MNTQDTHHDDHEDHGGLGKYGVVFLCLCALTLCSFMTTAGWWPFDKRPTWIFMMGVSTVKAMLVMLFFMHLLWEANWKYVLTVPCAMMSLFLLLMLVPDVGCRRDWYAEERLIYAAESVEEHVEQGGGHPDSEGHSDEPDGNAERGGHADGERSAEHAKETAH